MLTMTKPEAVAAIACATNAVSALVAWNEATVGIVEIADVAFVRSEFANVARMMLALARQTIRQFPSELRALPSSEHAVATENFRAFGRYVMFVRAVLLAVHRGEAN